MDVLLDTNVLIEEMKGRQMLDALPPHATPAISAVTITELLALSGMGEEEERRILALATFCTLIPVDQSIAIVAGRLKRTRAKRYTVDLLIAATALVYDCTLVTLNVRDFQNIPDLRVLKPSP